MKEETLRTLFGIVTAVVLLKLVWDWKREMENDRAEFQFNQRTRYPSGSNDPRMWAPQRQP